MGIILFIGKSGAGKSIVLSTGIAPKPIVTKRRVRNRQY